jgi:hypothetical protein
MPRLSEKAMTSDIRGHGDSSESDGCYGSAKRGDLMDLSLIKMRFDR